MNQKIRGAEALFYQSLEPGLAPEDRHDRLILSAKSMGWEVKSWPVWLQRIAYKKSWISWFFGPWIGAGLAKVAGGLVRVSQAFTPSRTIYLSVLSRNSPLKFINTLIAHELTHAMRAEDQGRFSWTAGYLFSKKKRFHEECAARSGALVMRARIEGLTEVDLQHAVVKKDYDRFVKRLTRGGWPYFTEGEKWKTEAQAQILRGAEMFMAKKYTVSLAHPLQLSVATPPASTAALL